MYSEVETTRREYFRQAARPSLAVTRFDSVVCGGQNCLARLRLVGRVRAARVAVLLV
jgi:hypothetical protein